jgi:hypothetical protein
VPKSKNTVKRLARVARYTALRLRTDEILGRTFALLPIPLVYAIGALSAIKALRLDADSQATLLWIGVAVLGLFAAMVLHAWLRRKPRLRGALALDRHHGLHDRITNALSFSGLGPEQRTALMDVAISDALNLAVDLKPRRAAPRGVPAHGGA